MITDKTVDNPKISDEYDEFLLNLIASIVPIVADGQERPTVVVILAIPSDMVIN